MMGNLFLIVAMNESNIRVLRRNRNALYSHFFNDYSEPLNKWESMENGVKNQMSCRESLTNIVSASLLYWHPKKITNAGICNFLCAQLIIWRQYTTEDLKL